MPAKKLLLLFAASFMAYLVIGGVLAFIGTAFHAAAVVAVIFGFIGLALFLGPGILVRRKRR